MIHTPLCINTDIGFDLPPEELLRTIRESGFDGVFTGWRPGAPVSEWAAFIRDAGLLYQSIHAPFDHVDTMWEEGEAGVSYLRMLDDCVRDAAENGVPMVIVHAIIGFDKHTPTDLGVERFDRLCRYADERGVLLGFENTEGEEYLARLLTELRHHPSCRFCWDTGHEMCYNRSRDLPALYGDLLAGTHLNDNFGVTGDEITWLDDAHLMPFDGAADWRGIVSRLHRAQYEGPLTFELLCKSKPGRNTHDRYAGMDFRQFMDRAFKQAASVSALYHSSNL